MRSRIKKSLPANCLRPWVPVEKPSLTMIFREGCFYSSPSGPLSCDPTLRITLEEMFWDAQKWWGFTGCTRAGSH